MQTQHIHYAETCLRTSQGPITLVSHEANRNAALSPFEKAERLRIEAATESRVNPAYLRGAGRCRVVVLVTRDRMLDDR
jgi:hypothetical protein